jgi:hypothetical protein
MPSAGFTGRRSRPPGMPPARAAARSPAPGTGCRWIFGCSFSPRWKSRAASASCRAPSWTRSGEGDSRPPPGGGPSSGAEPDWKRAAAGPASSPSTAARSSTGRSGRCGPGVFSAARAENRASRSGSTWRTPSAGRPAGARLTGIASPASLAVSARYGGTGGSPTRFDLFALGGSSSAILPPGLDRNRVESPALPAAVQIGPRFEAYRTELSPARSPLILYAERMRAWTSGGEKPDWIRLEGIELRLERLIPADLTGPLSLYLGAARVRSREPRFDSTRGYAGLLVRP